MLFVDSREKAPLREAVCSAVDETCVRKLECGDFVLFDKDGHSLGIERKEVGDLLGSLGQKVANGRSRLADQLDRMLGTYSHTVLLVEGQWSYDPVGHTVGTPRRRSGWLASVIWLMLWNIEAQGVYVLPTSSREHTAEVLRILHKRSLEGCVLPHTLREARLAA